MEPIEFTPPLDMESDASSPSSHHEPPVEITLKFPPEKHTQKWEFFPTDTFEHLTLSLSLEFPSYDWSKAKALLEKRQPGLKSVYTPSDDAHLPLSALHHTTLRLLAPQTSALTSLQSQSASAASWQAKRAAARARLPRLTPTQRATADDLAYTFHTLRPLPHLPNPAHSLALLERLKSDPGIRVAMKRRRFSVGLLTEMDPAAHTSATHEGVTRILGLNRNRGEVIELRLRTDAYDGWRDYRVVRKTLCHELAHNVHGDHDSKFWALCREIEKEVERADWKSGGQAVGAEEYAPGRGLEGGELEEGMVMDHGGWTGGTYVLGGGGGGGGGDGEGLSAREIRARAAEARWSNLERVTRQGSDHEREGSGGSTEQEQDSA
ncbi:WLM-domain-containing protein [Parathielavia hyrcaniae]|uniref:WLM-domain-containing protein n=1 Tax=Parathielavia hyrcaniae TaxID=113614 RepID=A0AAN6PUL6_9PEZI|nr:WLM-domain-containing protein [Parathielavia hyrcaniae]